MANDYFTQKHLKSFYPGTIVGGYYRTVYQIFDDLPDVEFDIVEMSNSKDSGIEVSYIEILEEEFGVVGLRHHDYYDAFQEKAVGIKVGDKLELVKDPNNPHDQNAIAVFFKGKCVGYISRSETEDVSELMSMSDNYHFSVSSEPFDTLQAMLSVNAHVNRKIEYSNHVVMQAIADIPNEIFEKYTEYLNALIGHDFILRSGFDNQLEFEAKRHRFFGRLNSKYLNVRAEQSGPLEGKLLSFSITDKKQIQIEFEVAFDDLKPRQCYEKLVLGLTSFFKGFERGKEYVISLKDLNELTGKRKTRLQYEPFIKYIQEYYLINLTVQDF